MTNVDDVIEEIQTHHSGAFWGVFHAVENGYKYLPSGHVLTPAAYLAVVRHFTGEEPAPGATLSDRRRNDLRAKAVAKGGGNV
ncbi:hypothetical protein [Roseovarius amoyensis]|uniref:hypothetical protein n=1 Tax=Roseovarius amoyensis TaxID=2211448 RepID=UPI0013A69B82|nr:hypothetical protein [Roseovarius amoyensis]